MDMSSSRQGVGGSVNCRFVGLLVGAPVGRLSVVRHYRAWGRRVIKLRSGNLETQCCVVADVRWANGGSRLVFHWQSVGGSPFDIAMLTQPLQITRMAECHTVLVANSGLFELDKY